MRDRHTLHALATQLYVRNSDDNSHDNSHLQLQVKAVLGSNVTSTTAYKTPLPGMQLKINGNAVPRSMDLS
uniref:Uncharacterized protein n=1 Tax=Anguilla anguilla TaxID=7936 RepID=A0A0E9XUJ0_ANGAN